MAEDLVVGVLEEEVLYQAHPAMFRNRPGAFVLCVLLAPVGVGLVVLLVWWVRCLGTELTVTDERSMYRRGLLSRAVREVWHADVCDFVMRQTFAQRMMGVGEVGISSAAESGFEIVATGIPRPDEVKRIIDEYRRRGLGQRAMRTAGQVSQGRVAGANVGL